MVCHVTTTTGDSTPGLHQDPLTSQKVANTNTDPTLANTNTDQCPSPLLPMLAQGVGLVSNMSVCVMTIYGIATNGVMFVVSGPSMLLILICANDIHTHV